MSDTNHSFLVQRWYPLSVLVFPQLIHFNSGHHIEFGAQQCILVRNDAAREKLRKQVGNIGLIMCAVFAARLDKMLKACRTLYESKGLEFNDVSSPLRDAETIAIRAF